MPRIVDRAEKRQQIREAARRVFSERGLAGTGLAHVAAAAGISRANLYNYYPDQAALIRDLAHELLAEEERLFEEALARGGSPLERIERLAATVTELFERWADVGSLLLQLWASDPGRVRPLFRSVRAVVTRLIEEGQSAGEVDASLHPPSVAALIVGILDGLVLQFFVDPESLTAEEPLPETLRRSLQRLLAPPGGSR